jgi:hypothetical protein
MKWLKWPPSKTPLQALSCQDLGLWALWKANTLGVSSEMRTSFLTLLRRTIGSFSSIVKLHDSKLNWIQDKLNSTAFFLSIESSKDFSVVIVFLRFLILLARYHVHLQK